MENQVMSSSSSSTLNPKKFKSTIMAMEEAENNNLKLGFSQQGMSENPSFGSHVGTRRDLTKFYPSKSNKIYTCHFCKKEFSSSQALGGHQNAHKQEREWDKKRKEMETKFPELSFLKPYLYKPHLLFGGYSQDTLSNDNHLGITLDPFNRIGSNMFASYNSGLTDRNMNIVPRVTPIRFFTGNTSTYGSSSRRVDPNKKYSLISRNITHFPPSRTAINVLREENFISKIEKPNIMEIGDDNEQSEEENGIDLSLTL